MEEWNGQTVGEVGDEGRGNGRRVSMCTGTGVGKRGEEVKV